MTRDTRPGNTVVRERTTFEKKKKREKRKKEGRVGKTKEGLASPQKGVHVYTFCHLKDIRT